MCSYQGLQSTQKWAGTLCPPLGLESCKNVGADRVNSDFIYSRIKSNTIFLKLRMWEFRKIMPKVRGPNPICPDVFATFKSQEGGTMCPPTFEGSGDPDMSTKVMKLVLYNSIGIISTGNLTKKNLGQTLNFYGNFSFGTKKWKKLTFF